MKFSISFSRQTTALIWDIVSMADHWGSDAWAGRRRPKHEKCTLKSNVFESQPELYMWAGRDFHQRPQQGLKRLLG
ncbi:carbohydrate porin [Vibrio chagasii]|nr:carbohydrate porin [Vibrio chagasii]